jgi:hypothetical protein
MMSRFRPNQVRAIETSVEEDFASGVHFHATGTGKSWVGLQLLASFHEAHPNQNVMWICEQKSILIDQFDKDTLQSKGFRQIFKQYLVLDYSANKQQDWTTSINSCKFWGKPILVIINRAFLTSNNNYEKIRLVIHLIIHDECHSINNATTQAFYTWISQKFTEIKCIGFSATPILTIAPFTRLISKYSIYDGVCDGVILPPRIIWTKSTTKLSDTDYAHLLKYYLKDLVYAKCVIWCGMIRHCTQLCELFRTVFTPEEGWLLTTDTSIDNSGYDAFYERKTKAILFCAAKHREGSDIPNLDSCVFLDKVEDRSHKVFIQCIGRVLRKDPTGAKKEGLIIDFKAKSSINICNRMNTYLNDSDSSHEIFPWAYSTKYAEGVNENCLQLIPNVKPISATASTLLSADAEYPFEDIKDKFIRKYDECDQIYVERLELEYDLFSRKKLLHHLLQAVEILKLVEYIPHVTRGSCGSSLLCYLLGISNVDPVKYEISFARFLNEFRESLPDIDFDFPHTLRDEVFLKLQMRWPGQIARISNHNFYHEKSAHREALRRIGIRGFLSTEDVPRIISELESEQKEQFDTIVEEIDETFRHYSLHCGGIVFFPSGVPKNLLHQSKNNTNVLRQITCNKKEIANDGRFKVDILSSRGLSQLHEAMQYAPIDFDAHLEDKKTADLLSSGDNVGLTLAESPLMRKAMVKFRPKSVEDVAKCLAIIRPAASDARNLETLDDNEEFIFDDDAIELLVRTLQCTPDMADKLRRQFSKGIPAVIYKNKKEFTDMCKELGVGEATAKEVLNKLRNLRKYSFCKAHSYSYAQLVWQLAYMKANHPLAFWKATLHNTQSSYKRWVHLTEAWQAGYHVNPFNQQDRSVHSVARRNKIESMNPMQQLQAFGCWDLRKLAFPPDCGVGQKEDGTIVFRGIFASYRRLSKKKLVCCIGVAVKQYVEVLCTGANKWMKKKAVGVEGRGVLVQKDPLMIESDDFLFF